MTDDSSLPASVQRRRLLQLGAGAITAPAFVRFAYGRGNGRPLVEQGVQSGDMLGDSAVIWSRSDREARMTLRWSTAPDMRDAREVPWVNALADTDFTAKVQLVGLPADTRIHYEVSFLDLADMRSRSEPVYGSFQSASAEARDIRFVWSGDTVGQGYGINPELGGMRIYETMRQLQPDFFIHSGDTIYADGPLESELVLPDGRLWHNVVTPEKSKVAETLAEYRGNFRYNLLDDNLRAFNAEVPMLAQWDDHEVTNNWYWEMRKEADERYQEGSVAVLAARAMRAFQEYLPVRRHPLDPERIYERFSYGPLLDIFRIDLRSYRGPNSDEQPGELSPEFMIFGKQQLAWLKQSLARSTATWKVIASDMPIGVIVYDDWETEQGAEGIALRDGAAAGRELEVADLLTFIRDQGIHNVVWLTADVHYTAAHYYDPAKAQYRHFAPFWEFVSGPLNAGTFGPNKLDNTFGPQTIFQRVPEPGQSSVSPLSGLQFFGQVDISAETRVMTVTLKDLEGRSLFAQELLPQSDR